MAFLSTSYSGKQWRMFIVFCFAYFFSACTNSIQAPFYPLEAEKKGASSTEYGLVFGIYQLVVFLASPIFGKYMNYLGPKSVLTVGMFTTGIMCFIFGFLNRVNDHPLFITLCFVIRIIEAVGSCGIVTSVCTILAGEFPSSIATTFASLEIFFGFGNIVGPTLGGALFELGGFGLPFFVTGLGLTGLALLTPWVMPAAKMDEENSDGFSLLTLLKLPGPAVSALTIWMSSNNVGFLNATLEPHLSQFHLSKWEVGLVFVCNGAAYMITAPFWGRVMDKQLPPQYTLLSGCLLLIVANLIVGPVSFIPGNTYLPLTCVGLAFHGIGDGAIQVAGYILALRDSIANGFPDNLATHGVVSGLWASFLCFGLFVGPSVGGVLLDISDFRTGSIYPLACSVIMSVLVLCFIIHERKVGSVSRSKQEIPEPSGNSHSLEPIAEIRINNV